MAVNIEKLLHLAADYHNFCSNEYWNVNNRDQDELSLEELDFVAAAMGATDPELGDTRDTP